VAFATRWAHEEFALWAAQVVARREVPRDRGRIAPYFSRLRRLCLWAWYSGQPGTAGHALIATPWAAEMQLRAAFRAADAWHRELTLTLSLGHKPVDDTWLSPGTVDGYAFVPLRSAADLSEEATAMENCVRTYAEMIARGEIRLWSVRKDGLRVATLEVARHESNPLPHINQLQLAKNAGAPAELWVVAGKWLRTLELTPAAVAAPPLDDAVHAVAWRAMWKPYWLAMRATPSWLRFVPADDALDCF
jgi:hypothetical protein